jgi:heme/copper-type cytochrome/quinol oxidase subunit 4
MDKTLNNTLDKIPQNPYYYQRRYDRDIPTTENKKTFLEYTKRITLIALPFLSLYKPFAFLISLSMNSIRSITLLIQSVKAGYNLNLKLLIISLLQTAIAVAALAFTFFSFPVGIVILTVFDLIQSLVNCIHFFYKKDYENGIRELLSVISSTLYIAIFLSGSLEVILISIALQAICSFYESRNELLKGKYPEAIAKILMGMIRIYQVRNQFLIIKRRNSLFSSEKFKSLKKRIEKGRKTKHLKKSELKDLEKKIIEKAVILEDINKKEEDLKYHLKDKKIEPLKTSELENLDEKIKEKAVILEDANNEKYNFGSHFHGYGKDKVKGLNICFKETKDGITLEFKVNHVAREKLKILVKELNKLTKNEKDLQDFLSFSKTKVTNISVEKLKFNFPKKKINIGKIQRIAFEGLGSISVGASKDVPNIYNKVFVKIDKNKNLNDMHALLSFLNLDTAICKSSEMDIERLKIGQLFRAFHPREATPFERSEEFFDLSIDNLKTQIIEKTPDMKEILKNHLPTMKQIEILPGKIRYAIPEISKKVKELGGECLTSFLTGSKGNEDLFDRTISILNMGMLSSESRYSGGMNVQGLSPSADFYEGSADSVFTQMITKKQLKKNMPLEDFAYFDEDSFQLIFSREILDTVSYQYIHDNYGSRLISPGQDVIKREFKKWGYSDRELENYDFDEFEKDYFPYAHRPSIFEFTKELNSNSHSFYDGWGSEVMIKERIPPSYIKKIIVPNENAKRDFMDYLKDKNIVKEQDGIKKILGTKIDDFIRVGTHLSEELIA